MIAPYIAYVRVGLAHAGENSPPCAMTGTITQDSWGTLSTVPAGYLVNSGNNQYLATGGGQIGTVVPTCSPAGCTTAIDGSVPGWYNSGQVNAPAGVPVWPGPKGQITEPAAYTDNGYLTVWPALSGDGTGYVTSMLSFLTSLGTSFPFDISAHSGPPSNQNTAYADSESIAASAYGLGFGMQSVNVGDSKTYAAQSPFPFTREDWAHNFQAYQAPVHHLQTNAPGSGSLAEGYNIDPTLGIVVTSGTGVATINCTADCTPLGGQEIYVAGNTDNALNGIWMVTCGNVPHPCPTNGLTFQSGLTSGCTPCGTGGVVWGPDYWPITMPFAVQHGVSSIEVWECSLDYAFGAYPNNTTTTAWVSTGNGCANWALLGPNTGYQNAATDAQIGQPSATSVLSGGSILINGSQF